MKILVIGAYGKVGQRVIQEAAARGFAVTGVAHRAHEGSTLATDRVLIKDAAALTPADLAGFDAIVDAIGAWDEKTAHIVYDGLHHIVQLLKGTETRYLKVGGTNTLYIDADHERQLQELSSYYPPAFRVLCDAHKKALEILRTYSNIAWTYVTPAFNFSAEGAATGTYHVEGEEFSPGPDGDTGKNDYISYADYAKGMVDIIESGQYLRQRITLIHGDKPAAPQG